MTRLDRSTLNACADRIETPIRDFEQDEIFELATWMQGSVDAFMAKVRPLLPAPSVVPGPRTVGRAATPSEDPLNAVVRWVNVQAEESARDSDLLAGKTVGMKDLIAVAGVPISAASRMLQGYIPAEDSVVTERVLRAGGRIVAMLNMEGMAYGGGGESGDWGATHNPHDPDRSTSGSSGGSAAALFYDRLDITFGTDQGGSVRLPASWCGVLGLKPTHSLVPYVGLASHDMTFDHVGPMTRTTNDMALAMAAVAGPFWGEPRQRGTIPALDYVGAVEGAAADLSGVRIGVLREARVSDGSAEQDAALSAFLEAVDRMEALGAEIVEVSVPEHTLAGDILFAGMLEGITATLHGFGEGYHWDGRHSVDAREAVGKGLKAFGGELQPSYKAAAIMGEYLRTTYFGGVYATAHNVIHRLRASYDAALEAVDAIVMPTTPTTAMELKPDAGVIERQLRSFSMTRDTPAHNATGHPALSMPAAEVDGMPLGVSLVGRHFSDDKLIGLARTYEAAYGWLPEKSPRYLGQGA